MKTSESIYDRIVRCVLYVIAGVLPLFYLPWTAGILEYNKQFFLVILVLLGLMTWLLGAVVHGKLTFRISPVDKGVLALWVASLVATLVSLTPKVSFFGTNIQSGFAFMTMTVLVVFYFLAVNTLHDRGRTLRTALMLSVGIALLLGILQMFGLYILPGAFTHAKAFNTVGSFNTLGIMAAVFLALSVKAASRASSRAVWLLALACVVLSVATLALLNWWGLWVVALVGMLALIAFDSLNMTQLAEDYGGKKNRFALSRFIVPVIVIVVGGFLLLVNFQLPSLKADLPSDILPTYNLSWHVAFEAVHQRPITGWGPDNFLMAFDRFGASHLATTNLSSARFLTGNAEIFDLAVNGGLLMLCALLFLLVCLVQVIRRFGSALSESIARGESAALAAQSSGVLAAMMAIVAALFLYPFNLVLWFVFVALLALSGLIIAGDRSRTIDLEERPMYSLITSLGFIVALILVLTGLYFMTVRYVADVRYGRAIQLQAKPEVAMAELTGALNLNATNDLYLRDASQLTLILLRAEVAKNGTDADRTQRIQNLMATATKFAQQAAAVQPLEAMNWNNLGQVYQSLTGLVGDVERLAQDAYTKGSQLRPGDPTFDNSIGQMWLARADLIRSLLGKAGADTASLQKQMDESLTKAADAFSRAITTSSTYGLAIYNLGAVYERQGKINDSIAQLEKIAPYNTDKPTLMFELGLLYIRAGRTADAASALQRAVILAPQYANARWYYALILEQTGNIDGALAQLYEIQKTNPDNADLQEKIAQLEAGKRSIPPGKVIDEKPLE